MSPIQNLSTPHRQFLNPEIFLSQPPASPTLFASLKWVDDFEIPSEKSDTLLNIVHVT